MRASGEEMLIDGNEVIIATVGSTIEKLQLIYLITSAFLLFKVSRA